MLVYGPGGDRGLGGRDLVGGDEVGRGQLGRGCERGSHKGKNHEGGSTEAETRGGTIRSSDEVPETGWSEGVVLWS